VIPPHRVLVNRGPMTWRMKPRAEEDLVLCHNDLSPDNIIVGPITLKIKAIIDREYAGFFPPQFEGMFYKRLDPSVALEGEADDAKELLQLRLENRISE
jgi:aminoglycoside phosphotransferase (APT) family kinase protein